MPEGIQPPEEFKGCSLETFGGVAVVLEAQIITIKDAHAGEQPPLEKIRETVVDGITNSPWLLFAGAGGILLAATKHFQKRRDS